MVGSAARKNDTPTSGLSLVKFHSYGDALLGIASTYPKLIDVILEEIQNALDVNACMIWVTINFKKRTVVIQDNGDGISIEEFEEALRSVNKSSKTRDKMGRYGRGLISPLGKCDEFTFTSCPKTAANAYQKWTFSTKDIEHQQNEVMIPNKPEKSLIFSRSQSSVPRHQVVPWRTEVVMNKFVKDNVLSRVSLEVLRDRIHEKYSVSMRQNKAIVHVTIIDREGNRSSMEVRAHNFSGEPMIVEKKSGKNSGTTSFEIYLAKKGRGKGLSVGLKGDPFRIGFSDFYKSHHELISEETHSILTCGLFEGYITSEFCRLDPGRKGFFENDALLEFCEHLEEWSKHTGNKYVEEMSDVSEKKKLQLIGSRTLKGLEELLKNPEFKDLMEIIRSFKKGTIGNHHTDMPNTVLGTQDEKSKRWVKEETKEDTTHSSGKQAKDLETSYPKEEDHPFTTMGPEGTRRTVVKGHSTGLQIQYIVAPGKNYFWQFHTISGILEFNVAHPLWQKAEMAKGKTVILLQQHVALNALRIETFPDKTIARDFVDASIPDFLELVIKSMRK